MNIYKYILVLLLVAMPSIATFAQIGYQVSLLNSATGQPRAGETVTVDIKLTNCENAEVYTTRQKTTSNDFGVLSLSVGDVQTFEKLDWNKLPLYIEVSIDGVLIAKSQVLSVPVAEYAKRSGFVLTKRMLISKAWKTTVPEFSSLYGRGLLTFNESNIVVLNIGSYNFKGNYRICDDKIILDNIEGGNDEFEFYNGSMIAFFDPYELLFQGMTFTYQQSYIGGN
ncbi:MAG: hypothetical protein IJE15_04135 [Bacteroidaceae bacterium]|nr:hypothetical protein [Bacteroidaceae bacterium]